MKRAAKTIECFNDIRKYLFEHKVPCLQFIRDGKVEVLYTQMYIDEKDKEIERLNNIIKNTAVELEILLESGNKDLIKMQLRNIVFRLQELKGSDKEWVLNYID